MSIRGMCESENGKMQTEERKSIIEDHLKILIATDLHVGYAEKVSTRAMDSYRTLEEVLQIAVNYRTDMVLLGGDLFHYNSPSRTCVHRVTRLLRKYCLSDEPVSLKFLSDPAINFSHSVFPSVNYEDCNINVGLPVFSIHGNHDAPFGGGYTALDTLHECGLLNLFGSFESIDDFEVMPILLEKAGNKLAIYGIGHQRDDRLCRAFREEKVRFLRPQEDTESWFNILVLHQNRPQRSRDRSTGAHLPESLIPSFFDLVIWGHEHECKIEPQYYDNNPYIGGDGFYIMQPGSTIATSLSQEESGAKCVAVVTINKRNFFSTPIQLKTVRPFLFDDIIIDCDPPKGCNKFFRLEKGMPDERFVVEKITSMLNEHATSENRESRSAKLLPLLRLRVHYHEKWNEVKKLDTRILAKMFADRIVNIGDMLTIKADKPSRKKGNVDDPLKSGNIDRTTTVEEIIHGYFNSTVLHRLKVLSPSMLNDLMKLQNNEDRKRNASKDLLSCIRAEKERLIQKFSNMAHVIECMDISDHVKFFEEVEKKLMLDMENLHDS